MWTRAFVAVSFMVIVAAQRPKSCPVGTQYKVDCNTCACAADGKDKCSTFDCSRPTPTPAAGNKPRPGDCPTLVTPAPGSDICKKRTEKSSCTDDKSCPQAKKCCIDGCGIYSCRAAIYRYTK